MFERKYIVQNQSITDDNVFYPIAVLDTKEEAVEFARSCAFGDNPEKQVEEVIYIRAGKKE